MGEISRDCSSRSLLYRYLVRARAVGIPNREDSRLVIRAILKLLNVPWSHSSVPKKFWYHCNENPLGGNSKYLAELKEIGMTINSGAIRNAKMSPQTK
jgi:hypothetical protein